MTDQLKQAAQAALEALESLYAGFPWNMSAQHADAIHALRAALTEPEPHHHGDNEAVCWCNDDLREEIQRLREYNDTLIRERNAAWAESAELRRRAELFDALQNMPVEEAQAYFWNYSSRKVRAKAIRDRALAADAAMKEPK